MKKITSILVALMLFTTTSFASPIDTINQIRNRSNSQKVSKGNTLILNALNKNKNEDTEIKIIDNEKSMEEQIKEKENKEIKGNKNSYIIGLDISKWNGDIDWKEVKKANVEFVIIRGGYGANYVDPYFKKNMENAIKNDMVIGVYWFSYAYTDEMAKAEAEKCYEVIKPYKDHITLPVFWDFEYDSVRYVNSVGHSVNKTKASSMGDVFCKTIKSKGLHAGIYTNIDYANRYFSEEVLEKYHTWIAQWTSECTYKNHYIIWQRTDRFYIGRHKFDLNRLYYNRYKEEIANEK